LPTHSSSTWAGMISSFDEDLHCGRGLRSRTPDACRVRGRSLPLCGAWIPGTATCFTGHQLWQPITTFGADFCQELTLDPASLWRENPQNPDYACKARSPQRSKSAIVDPGSFTRSSSTTALALPYGLPRPGWLGFRTLLFEAASREDKFVNEIVLRPPARSYVGRLRVS
jgi:hypothetical protein